MDTASSAREFVDTLPADRLVHALSLRAAKRLSHLLLVFIPAGMLAGAEREFYRIVREALEDLKKGGDG